MTYYLTEFDILDSIYEIRSTFLNYIMHFFTLLGESGIFWITLVIILIIYPKTRRVGLSAAAALLLEFICVNLVLKPIVKRIRPCYANTSRVIDTIVSVPNDYSFPSGHAGTSFVVSTVIARHNMKYGIISLITSVLIGFSRLYFYVHYPSDVLTGAMIGVFAGIIMDKVVTDQFKKHDAKNAAEQAVSEQADTSSEETEEQEKVTAVHQEE